MNKLEKLAALLTAFCLLAGCNPQTPAVTTPTPSPTPTPTVAEFALPYDPAGGLHPLTTTSATNLTLMPLLYEGLFAVNAKFEAEPVLCQNVTKSEGGKVWRFLIKSGVTCSNGTAVTAELCKSSILAAKESALYSGRLREVATMEAEGQHLTVTLTVPNANLPLLLDVPIFAAGENGAVAGTGPYVLGENRLTARKDWWQKKQLPQEILPLFESGTADDLVYAFDSGEVGLVTADLTGAAVLGYSGNYEVGEYPATNLLYLGFNARSGLCAEGALRRAIAQGLDRNTICASLLAGHGVPAALPVHPAGGRYDEKAAAPLQYSEKNLSDALETLGWQKGKDGLRYRGGKVLTLRLLVSGDNSFKVAVAEFIGETLKAGGVAVTVQKGTWEEYNKALKAGTFDLYLGETKMTADFDSAPLFFLGGSLNFGGFSSPELEQKQLDAKGTGLESQFYTQFAAEVPFAPLCFKSCSVLTQWGRVSGATPTAGNVFYGMENWKIK